MNKYSARVLCTFWSYWIGDLRNLSLFHALLSLACLSNVLISLCSDTHALVYDYFGIHVTKVRQHIYIYIFIYFFYICVCICVYMCVSLYLYTYMCVQRETCVYTMLTTSELVQVCCMNGINVMARLAQSAERKALNLVVVGSSPTVGVWAAERFARRYITAKLFDKRCPRNTHAYYP